MRDQSEASTVRLDLVGTAAGDWRPPEDLVGELAEAFLERHRRGERPSIEEYAAALPELAGEPRCSNSTTRRRSRHTAKRLRPPPLHPQGRRGLG
jgi:hypothetical protein